MVKFKNLKGARATGEINLSDLMESLKANKQRNRYSGDRTCKVNWRLFININHYGVNGWSMS